MKYGKMMKGIGVAALALTVVSSCIVGGTLAKYTTTATGQGTAIVAKWAPTFQFGTNGTFSASTDVNLTDGDVTDGKKLVADKIAPGTEGSFGVQLTRGDTEVGFTYEITISEIANQPANLKFYKEDGTTELLKEGDVYKLTPTDHTMDANATGAAATKTVVVKWKWPYEKSANSTENDATDTADGTAGKTMSFKLNCTATQVNPK